MNRINVKAIAIAFLAASAACASAQTVQVTVNGSPINFPDAQPQTVNGHVLVPLRGVFEALGAEVLWDPATQSISASTDVTHVRLKIGDLEANVNGQVVDMDTAPAISGGSTLVPLRFLSQSLGAKVDWDPQQNLVAITNRPHPRHHDNPHPQITPPPAQMVVTPPPPPPQPMPQYVIPRYTVIPLVLDQPVSSNGNHDGDVVSATVRDDRGQYLKLPNGTLIQGVVRHAHAAGNGRPGMLEIRFTHLLLPSGARIAIYGTAVPFNDPNIYRGRDGRIVAKPTDDVNQNIGRDAAIGAGAGLVWGSMHERAIRDATIGGIVGAVAGAFASPRHDNNVFLNAGTRLGLIIGRDLAINWRDMR